MGNPVLVELARGPLVESRHAGALAVADADGRLAAAAGDVAAPVFPRSAVKPLQALALVETGAAEAAGFGEREIAAACASHTGTRAHTALVGSMLARAGLDVRALACGCHEPMDAEAARELIRAGAAPSALHHNCSGKHAAMLATAVHMREPTEGYWRPDHPVQRRIEAVLGEMSGCRLGAEVRGIDGCSVPNWAMPLAALARAFARLATGRGLMPARAEACRRVREACWAHPELVAGPGWLVSEAMRRLPGRVLVKSGAEGVYCGALAERGLGFALKIDDGARRAAEAVTVEVLARAHPEARRLGPPATLVNWRGLEVGRMRPAAALVQALEGLA